LQDVLGLLTTIFKFGQHKDVAMAAERAFNTLSIDCYLEAVPQLTAQLNYPSARLQPIIEQHMQRLARAHPHTLLASLTAVTQYPSQPRAVVAKRLVNVMRLYDDTLVSEAMLLSDELMRTAITWEEKCCHCVEASAKYIFGEGKRSKCDPFMKVSFEESQADQYDRPCWSCRCDGRAV
jgi:FKBP12-rapamycin complex-associated protein